MHVRVPPAVVLLLDLDIADPRRRCRGHGLLLLRGQILVHSITAERMTAQNDLFRHAGGVRQNLHCTLDGIASAGRAGHGRVDQALLHQTQSALLTVKAVQPDDPDVSPPELLQRQMHAVGHVVIVRKDHMHTVQQLRIVQQRILRAVARRVAERPPEHLDGSRIHHFCEGLAAFLAGIALGHQLQHARVALLLIQQRKHRSTGLLADLLVVRADEERIVVALDRAVEHDDRQLRIHVADDRDQLIHVRRRDDQQIDAVFQQAADILLLLLIATGSIGEDEPDVFIFFRFGFQLLLEHQPPLLAEVGQRDADQVLHLRLPCRAAAKQPREQAQCQQQRKRPTSPFQTSHHRSPECSCGIRSVKCRALF